ncbi:MAG: diadenylate cyclase CdaA [Bryobacteraceae bacterium]
MPAPLAPLNSSLPKLTFSAVVDILVVAFLIYQLILVVRGTRAAQVLAGIVVLLLVYASSIWLGLELVRSILATVVPYTAIALLVLFQSEIRRTLARIGRRHWLGLSAPLVRRESTDEILWALARLSQRRFGALVVLERDMGLRTFIESGQLLDAVLSRDLLLSIFQPGGPLHDGAVIVQGDRIAAAACFLPLSTNPALSGELGSRHRAAIGITEESDALAIVVSEETGRISVAVSGHIELDLTPEQVGERIIRHFGYKLRRTEAAPAAVPAAPAAGSEIVGGRRSEPS